MSKLRGISNLLEDIITGKCSIYYTINILLIFAITIILLLMVNDFRIIIAIIILFILFKIALIYKNNKPEDINKV